MRAKATMINSPHRNGDNGAAVVPRHGSGGEVNVARAVAKYPQLVYLIDAFLPFDRVSYSPKTTKLAHYFSQVISLVDAHRSEQYCGHFAAALSTSPAPRHWKSFGAGHRKCPPASRAGVPAHSRFGSTNFMVASGFQGGSR